MPLPAYAIGAIKRLYPDGEENDEIQKRWLEFQEIRQAEFKKICH